MNPLVAVVAVQALASMAQMYNSEKARGAEKDRLDELERMFDRIKPPDYDMKIQDPPELIKSVLASPKMQDPATIPQFNLSALTPEDLKVIGTYNPQVAQQIKEVAPTTIQRTGDMQEGRAAQLNALRKYKDISESSFDPIYQQQVQDAARRAQSEAQARSLSTLSDAQRRGTAGSGLEFAANLSGSANAMNSAAQANQAAAAEAYRNRLNALSQGAELGSRINTEDVNLQGRNADIINAYNQRNAMNAQNYANNRANTLNQAGLYNLQTAQDLSNKNIGNRNQASMDAQARQDALTKYLYGARNDSITQQNYNRQLEYGNQFNERNYQNNVASQLANWQQQQREYKNTLEAQKYADAINKTNGKAGITNSQINAVIGRAQDQNQGIQGLGNAASVAAMAYKPPKNDNSNNDSGIVDDENPYGKSYSWG